MAKSELYDEIKKKDHKARICFFTASELYYEKFRKREYDAIGKTTLFIQKPINTEELLEEVNRIIHSS
jgi:response regulator RpfG family c-di-GMP phosphodiesterase